MNYLKCILCSSSLPTSSNISPHRGHTSDKLKIKASSSSTLLDRAMVYICISSSSKMIFDKSVLPMLHMKFKLSLISENSGLDRGKRCKNKIL